MKNLHYLLVGLVGVVVISAVPALGMAAKGGNGGGSSGSGTAGGGSVSAADVSSGQFGQNTGGGTYAFPGFVGISTQSPTEKLEVLGNIKISGADNGLVFHDGSMLKTGSFSLFFGYQAGLNNTTGAYNTGIGYKALNNNSTGNSNVAIGQLALSDFTNGSFNIAIGKESMVFGSGNDNVAIGHFALAGGNPTANGDRNIAIGNTALAFNLSGNDNIAIGPEALHDNTVGIGNVAIGKNAARRNVTGGQIVAIGYDAMGAIGTNAAQAVAIGFESLKNTTQGSNTAVGDQTLTLNTSGNGNTAIGHEAMYWNLTGNYSTALGDQALYEHGRYYYLGYPAGRYNAAVGYSSMRDLRNGEANTALGAGALGFVYEASSTIAIGRNAGCPSTTTCTNNIIIGTNIMLPGGTKNTMSIANVIYGTGLRYLGDNTTTAVDTGAKIGIGTATPQSTLHVASGYIQFPTISGSAPSASDCNEASEAGRVVVRTDGPTNLYVCTGVAGWAGK